MSSACVTHNHVTRAGGDTIPGVLTQSRVTITVGMKERVITDACVTEARYVVPQGPITKRVVLVAAQIVRECYMSNGSVVATISARIPYRCTGIIAFVRDVIAASTGLAPT